MLNIDPPVMIASGTFGWDGYGRGIEPQHIENVGAIVLKTATMQPLEGNPEPRWYPKRWFADKLLFNSVGLTNPGLAHVLNKIVPEYQDKNVIISILGNSPEEFVKMAIMIDCSPYKITAIELNLSCPNIKDYTDYGRSLFCMANAVKAVRNATNIPIIVKLAPHDHHVVSAETWAVQTAGANAVTISNTIPAMVMNNKGHSKLGTATGGLSGMALHPIALALVYNVLHSQYKIHIPIIGCGGVENLNSARDFIYAGAKGVQVGSANLANFMATQHIAENWESYKPTWLD